MSPTFQLNLSSERCDSSGFCPYNQLIFFVHRKFPAGGGSKSTLMALQLRIEKIEELVS